MIEKRSRLSCGSRVAAIALAAASVWSGCASNGGANPPTSHAESPAGQPSATDAPTHQQMIAHSWREQIRRGAWPQIDRWYARFSAAIPREDPSAYRKYVKQTKGRDADVRANGYIGITAANPEDAAGRLDMLIGRETDPNNRTIIVWCLRFIGNERAAIALGAFLKSAKDVDYGLCLDSRGRIVQYQAPFPLAAPEAFKALYVIKGAPYMLEGRGWTHVLDRLARNIDTEPLRVDWARLKADTRGRETDQETAERMMREFETEPRP